jgi:hypothetical protein
VYVPHIHTGKLCNDVDTGDGCGLKRVAVYFGYRPQHLPWERNRETDADPSSYIEIRFRPLFFLLDRNVNLRLR